MFADAVKSYFDKTPGGALANKFKSDLIQGVKDSPGVGLIRDNAPQIQQFYSDNLDSLNRLYKENSPIAIWMDECSMYVETPLGARHWRNPFCMSLLPVANSQPELTEDYTSIPEMPEGDASIYFAVPKRLYTYEQGSSRNTTPQGWAENNTFFNVIKIEYPYTGSYRIPDNNYPHVFYVPEFYIKYERRRFQSMNGVYFRAFWAGTFPERDVENMRNDGWSVENSEGIFHPNSTYTRTIIEPFEHYARRGESSVGLIHVRRSKSSMLAMLIHPASAVQNKIQTTKSDLSYGIYNPTDFNLSIPGRFPGSIPLTYQGTDIYGNYYFGIGEDLKVRRGESRWEIISENYIPEPEPEPPPPPKGKKPKECKCMCCDDSLLKLVLKRIGSLPARVPDNFTKQNPSFINVESLAELALWQMQQLDALMGAYPIEIEIEDSDLTQSGNQKQKLSVPNQAEAIAELLGLLLTVKRDTHATLITAIKAMTEAGMSKQLGVKTLDVALANAEFLGYKLEQKKKEIPSLFTPGGRDIGETLKEKNIEIITYENTDEKDLQDDLKILKTMAARWNAQNWRKVDINDPGKSLKDNLVNNIKAVNDAGNEDSQDDFNDFTEQCERGFIDITGITDTEKPWGRQYNERPKIREIGTDKSRYNNDGTEKVD